LSKAVIVVAKEIESIWQSRELRVRSHLQVFKYVKLNMMISIKG